MPRMPRVAPGGLVFHVLNRSNARATLFRSQGDYAAFERILAQVAADVSMRFLAYCIMPNHWHLILWPMQDGDLGRFMQRITTTHARRWHRHRNSVGQGHVYQGTYKSFPVQDDGHLLSVCRYVERNPLRANLVARAEDWRWSSLWRRGHAHVREGVPALHDWPVDRPENWLRRVNQAESAAELEALRVSVRRGRPFGAEAWQRRMAKQLNLQAAFRPRGRPKAKGK
jgi:putative transposase